MSRWTPGLHLPEVLGPLARLGLPPHFLGAFLVAFCLSLRSTEGTQDTKGFGDLFNGSSLEDDIKEAPTQSPGTRAQLSPGRPLLSAPTAWRPGPPT